MTIIRLAAVVNEKHELIVTLPDDVPIGPVELLLQPVPVSTASDIPLSERERIHAQLLAAGLLVRPEDLRIPANLEFVSDEELLALGVLPPGAPTSDQLIDEDRGER